MRELTVWVGAAIIYLYGTVNGAETTFTLVGDGYWQATAPRSEDDAYHLHLEAYSANGLEGVYEYTIYYYGMTGTITDRTTEDVRRGTDKGFYNASDFNRVEHNVKALADLLNGYHYQIDVNTKTNWTMQDIIKAEDRERYLSNLQTLKDRFFGTVPLPETMERLNHEGANNIERLIDEIYTHIRHMECSFRPCGTFAAGQTVFLPRSVI